jgi:hypothetical protein
VNDGIYYPNYSQIDANIQGIVYKLPANVHPVHIPDK